LIITLLGQTGIENRTNDASIEGLEVEGTVEDEKRAGVVAWVEEETMSRDQDSVFEAEEDTILDFPVE